MVTENIKKAVAKRDTFNIRSYLIANILIDKSLTGNFKDCFEYCVKNGIPESEIYEPHNGIELSDEVTKENYSKLWGGLNSNFSRERVEALKKIAIKLYPPKIDSNNNQGGNNNNASNNYQRCGNSARYAKTDKDGNKLIYAIVAGVAVLIGIVLFAG